MTVIDPVELDDNDEPDFAAVYEPHVDGDGWQMTPRMAWHLWSAALYLADEWRSSHLDGSGRGAPARGTAVRSGSLRFRAVGIGSSDRKHGHTIATVTVT